MGAKYQTNSATGYNSSPPSDDGSQTAANLITWAGIKSKLADPPKTLADDINTDLVAAFDYAVRRITSSDSTVAGDHMRCVEIAPNVSTAVVVSLGDATTMTNIYRVYIKNSSVVNQTIGRVTSGDTIDRVAQNITIPAGACFEFQTTNAADGYLLIGKYDESEPDMMNGRITLTSGTPVTTADVTSATTIYYTPYKGNKVTLYDGIRWRRHTFTEVSLSVPSTSSTVYDLFLYDNSGTLTLDATAWTNGTTRATALTTQDGVYVKTGATGRRYLGTFRTTAGINGQTEDSAARRFVWNYHNRVSKHGLNHFTANRTTTSTTYVELNSEIRCEFLVGVSEDAVQAYFTGGAAQNAAGTVQSAVGFDGTTGEDGAGYYNFGANSNGYYVPFAAMSAKPLAVGYHYATGLGAVPTGGGTGTWVGGASSIAGRCSLRVVLNG